MKSRSAFALHSAIVAVLLVSLAGAGAANAQTADGGRLTLDMFMQLQSARGPQISPDGTRIVYTRGRVDTVNDSRDSELWIMNADGSHKRKLVDGSSATWSPDGTRIAYTASGEPRGSQVWVRWMDAEGAASQITNLTRSPSSIAWSPDGTRIAFRQRLPADDEWSIRLPERPEGAKWTATPRIIDRPSFRRDRQGFVDPGHFHIFVVSADGGPERQVSEGDFDHGSPVWSPDGATMYFSGLLAEDAAYQ